MVYRVVRILGVDIPLPLLATLLWQPKKSKTSISEFRKNYGGIFAILRDLDVKKPKNSNFIIMLDNVSNKLMIGDDEILQFFGSCIALITSVPEVVRDEWRDEYGYLKEEFARPVSNVTKNINYNQRFYEIPVFEIIVSIYYNSLEVAGVEEVDSKVIDILRDLRESSVGLKKEKPELKEFYTFLTNYSNRLIKNEYELTFYINFLHQLFIEYIYEKRPKLDYGNYVKFCNQLGKILDEAVVEFEQLDIIGIYEISFKTWKLCNK